MQKRKPSTGRFRVVPKGAPRKPRVNRPRKPVEQPAPVVSEPKIEIVVAAAANEEVIAA